MSMATEKPSYFVVYKEIRRAIDDGIICELITKI